MFNPSLTANLHATLPHTLCQLSVKKNERLFNLIKVEKNMKKVAKKGNEMLKSIRREFQTLQSIVVSSSIAEFCYKWCELRALLSVISIHMCTISFATEISLILWNV